jgi:hypothetical protein
MYACFNTAKKEEKIDSALDDKGEPIDVGCNHQNN